MKQRRRRLCTTFLCAVLIATNVFSTCLPVYAKTPDADTTNESGSVEELTELPTDRGSESIGSNENGDGSSDNNDNTGNNDGSSDSNDNTGNNDGSSDSNDNTGNNDGSSDNNDNTGNNDDSSDHNDGNDINDGSSGSNGSDDNSDDIGSDDSDKDDATDENDDTPETPSVSDNDAATDTEDTFLSSAALSDTDYPTEDPAGYKLSEIKMEPGSYSAAFSAHSQSSVYDYYLRILYTTDGTDEFFKGVSKVSSEELSSSQILDGSFRDLDYSYEWDDQSDSFYQVSGTFAGADALTPETTYYYRLAYYNYNSTESKYYYHFLTVPAQFTTGPPVTETSVSIKDISVEEIGYQKAKVVWTISNPDKSPVSRIRLHCTDSTEDGQSNDVSGSLYRDKDGQIVPDTYYAFIDQSLEKSPWVKKASATLETYIGAGEKITVASSDIDILFKDTTAPDIELTVTEKTGSNSFQTLVTLSPYYPIDEEHVLTVFYRSKGTQSWKSVRGSIKNDSEEAASASANLVLLDLTENTEYEYYIAPQGPLAARSVETFGSEDQPNTFTTEGIVTYEDTDFPDETFRSLIRQEAGIGADAKITSDKLETLTELSYSRSSASGEIHSLKGIEHLVNLTEINFQGHSITDAGGLSDLKNMTRLNLEFNDLTDLPDLSGMSWLKRAYFEGNRIAADKITEEKLPAALLTQTPDWVADTVSQQCGDISAVFAPRYYAMGDTRPFLAKVSGLKKDSGRKYTLTLSIGEKAVSSNEIASDSNYYDMYYIRNILTDSSGAATDIAITEDAPCEAQVTLTDQYGNIWLKQDAQFTFTADIAGSPVAETRYIKPNAKSVYIQIANLPASCTEEQISSVTLVDADGKKAGKATSLSLYSNSYDPYEDCFGYYYISGLTTSLQSQTLSCTMYFSKYLTMGMYKAVITCTDQTSYTVENTVSVDNTAVLTYLHPATDPYYDNYGDYLYVTLSGINIDPTKVRPVFYHGNTVISEFVNAVPENNEETYLYKLKKLQKNVYWNAAGSTDYTYRFEADPSYAFIDMIKDKQISLSASSEDFVSFEHYNYKKGLYEVKTDSTVDEGTKVSVSVYSDSKYETCMGTAEDTITEEMLSLAFADSSGNSYAPPQNKAAYFIYAYTDKNGKAKTFNHTNSTVRWYNYSTGSSGDGAKSIYSDTIRYHAQPLKKLSMHLAIPEKYIFANETVTAQIYKGQNSIGSSVTFTKGKTADGYVNHTGTWSDSSGLSEGVYRVQYMAGASGALSHDLYVYDDSKFYMNNQWAGSWSSSNKSGTYVEFSSEQLAGHYIHKYNGKVTNEAAMSYWNDGGFRLELFDLLGDPVTDWKLDHVSWSGSNFTLYLTGLSQEYIGVYAKISKAEKLGIRLSSGTVHYSDTYNANETYGVWHSLGSSGVWFSSDDTNTNAYYGFSSYAYPVTVTITRPYDTTVIDTFTVKEATNNNYYYFTAGDLQKTDPKEAYRMTAVNADGSHDSEIGYLAVKGDTTVVNATGVTLDKTTLNMQLAQTETLTATVKPDNATNKNVTWSSDNTAVATVNTAGVVTAAGTGTAKITATTHNGKTASCTVQVYNYTINHTSLHFDLSAEPDRTEVLKVNDGTADISDITWSSNDESVVTVSRAGLVTPVGAGTAKILAAVKNGPTLTCDVTVSRNQLNGVTLNMSSCTLYLDAQNAPVSQMPDTQQLKLFVTPSDVSIESVTWASDKPAVASVAENGINPLTAVVTARSRGAAKISATVTTKSGSETAVCEVVVKTATTVDDASLPTGLTALTNEQLTLADVKLPQGWTWHEPSRSVSLKQFAGVQSKSFLAQYNDPQDADAKPFEKDLSVAFTTVTGIAIGADSSSLQKGKSSPLSVLWDINGAPLDLSAYGSRVEWTIDKPAVAKLSAASGSEVTLDAVEAGNATVKAQIKFADNKLLKTQFKITVTEGAPAAIQVTAVDGFSADAQQKHVYYGTINTTDASNTGTIHVTVTGADKLTLKNNNAKVIKTDKPTAVEGGYNIPLTMKAAGMAKITLIANDAAKTQTEIRLHVSDAMPNVSDTPVTINLQQTTGTAFALYPCTGYQVTNVSLAGSDAGKFTLNTDASPEQYVIKAADGTATGTYKLTLQGTVKDGAKEYNYDNVPLTVKVVDQKPKFKIKQTAKVNLFYKNWENSRLTVTSEETLDRVELADCDFTVENVNGSHVLKAKGGGLAADCDKKGTLTLHFSGYKDITADFTVGVEKKAPACKFSSKTVTLYPDAGLNSAILNPTVYQPDGNPYADVTYELDSASSKAGFALMNDEKGNLLIQYTGKGGQNASYGTTFTLSHSTWTNELDVPFTVKVSKNKPAAKLAKTTLQLNTNSASMAYDAAATAVMWKDGAAFTPAGVSVSAADGKSQAVIQTGIVFQYDGESQQVIARLNNTAVAPGSYKFKVNIRATDTLTVSTPLTVKVTDTAMDKAVKISAKGNIDVLNREGTYVTVTPSLKSLNGTITGVRLSGRAAHLFLAECEDGKVFIYAKPNAALITKYNYKVKLDLNIENAAGDSIRYMTPEINLKLKQGKPKAAVSPKSLTIYSGTSPAITRRITATLKGRETELPIENVELLNETDAFQCDYTDAGNNGPVITLRNTAETIKGKTYKLQLKVTFRSQADNEKATVIRYSVKVK